MPSNKTKGGCTSSLNVYEYEIPSEFKIDLTLNTIVLEGGVNTRLRSKHIPDYRQQYTEAVIHLRK